MDDTHLNFNHPASCSIEDAVLYLLDFKYEDLQPKWDGNEWVDHPDYLLEEIEDAEVALSEAKDNQCSADLIKQKQDAYDLAMQRVRRAHELRCEIVNELNIAKSGLVKDMTLTPDIKHPFITFVSLQTWAREVHKKHILEDLLPPKITNKRSQRKSTVTNEESPWLIPDPHDPLIIPKVDRPWYTPARYFARKYKADSSLHSQPICVYVSEQLARVGFTPHQKKNKKYGVDTILKAFVNVDFK